MSKTARWILASVSALCLASVAQAADSPEGTLVTDPAVLAGMGLSPDAIAYIAAPGDAVPAPQPYGGADPIQVEYSGNSFRGRISTYAYDTQIGAGDVRFTGGDQFADVQFALPSGALLENVRWWVSDSNAAADIFAFLWRTCIPAGGSGIPFNTELANGASAGATGEQSFVLTPPAGTTVDNNTCFYFARVRFAAPGLILRKIRVQYRLQVSPAPATATFPSDVPTSHPMFRFVEAMARSGLTSGCGPGAFCPNEPVTRGQLSVFLSAALGLHFPN